MLTDDLQCGKVAENLVWSWVGPYPVLILHHLPARQEAQLMTLILQTETSTRCMTLHLPYNWIAIYPSTIQMHNDSQILRDQEPPLSIMLYMFTTSSNTNCQINVCIDPKLKQKNISDPHQYINMTQTHRCNGHSTTLTPLSGCGFTVNCT